MEENFEQNQESNPCDSVESTHEKKEYKDSCCWFKYLVITLAAFFGAFLAVYFVADLALHRYFMPSVTPSMMNTDELDDVLKAQDQMMQDFTKFRPVVNPFLINPVKIQTFQEDDEYKIIIDLKPFGGNEKNIKVDVKPNSVKLSGESDKKDKNSENRVSFSQNFSLPQKVDVTEVTKEKNGNRYIITIPIED